MALPTGMIDWCIANGYDPQMLTNTNHWFSQQLIYAALKGVTIMAVVIVLGIWALSWADCYARHTKGSGR